MEMSDEFGKGISGIERGGIKVCRPLLTFSKDQLIATCKEKGVQWVEDESNKDRTLTPRNAIRYLMQSNSLPRALSTQSLLEVASKVDRRITTREGNIQALLDQTKFLLDLRTGQLEIQQLPRLSPYSNSSSDRPVPSEKQEYRKKSLRNIATTLLQRLISLVSPQPSVQQKDLEYAATAMFPQLWDQSRHALTLSSFTVAKVQCSRLVQANESEELEMTWFLHRQPMTVTERKKHTVTLPLAAASQLETRAHRSEVSLWLLWDGRYWIRLRGQRLGRYRIRAFKEADQAQFLKGKSRTKAERDKLEEILHRDAKAKVRWTLPVIVKIEEEGLGKGFPLKDKAVALPTLGYKLPDESIQWHIHYKKIDLGERLWNILEPPFSEAPLFRPKSTREIDLSPISMECPGPLNTSATPSR
ncbi:MAG: hypothetical protein M1821_000446 [Bathelium mastoideum]|nr:MAG: hypothetical protein M1821_000446 [Bathelium mastoideum]KAI9686260.1 MAG: hypothetical protein M1822_003916 [Bathelium mastoideum]